MMKTISKSLFAILIFSLSVYSVQAQNKQVVQVTGVAKMKDSSDVVPFMGVFVKNKTVGTLTNENGLFSLLCAKGDTLVFSGLGYQPKELIVPANLEGNYFNTIQYFVQDTFYLKEALVRAYLTPEELDYAIRYKNYDNVVYALARANTSRDVLDMLLKNLPRSGSENTAYWQSRQAIEATYYRQQAPIGLFNPFSWAKFIQALQNGDFRNKK